MPKKVCPNGHVYDTSIYGDTCPMCPQPSASASSAPVPPTRTVDDGHTRIIPPSNGGPTAGPAPQNPVGPTRVNPEMQQQLHNAAHQQQAAPAATPRTVIRTPGRGNAAGGDSARKLVGFLVTYNRTPMGKSFNIYEGRTTIGRDASCDIRVPDDNLMSGHHLTIQYLSGNNKFRFRDEMSSNGTYINKELCDTGELQNYDIIRIGSTLFIFIAIPQIG